MPLSIPYFFLKNYTSSILVIDVGNFERDLTFSDLKMRQQIKLQGQFQRKDICQIAFFLVKCIFDHKDVSLDNITSAILEQITPVNCEDSQRLKFN